MRIRFTEEQLQYLFAYCDKYNTTPSEYFRQHVQQLIEESQDDTIRIDRKN